MQQYRQPPRPIQKFSGNKKRYGWLRLYVDFPGHPKWRVVARRAGVHLAFVHAIAVAIFCSAAKAKNRGYVGDIDFDTVGAALDIEPDQVASTYRAFCEIGWIEQDYIADWLDRQPEAEDPTATERQRNKRAKDRARRAVRMGTAKPEDVELLSVADRENLARLERASRVTTEAAAPPVAEPKPFSGDEEGAARVWLLGDGGAGYGPACKLVADHYGLKPINADGKIRRWLQEDVAGDASALATILTAAGERTLNNEHFRNLVDRQIAEYVRERVSGPALPFGMTAVTGGRS